MRIETVSDRLLSNPPSFVTSCHQVANKSKKQLEGKRRFSDREAPPGLDIGYMSVCSHFQLAGEQRGAFSS